MPRKRGTSCQKHQLQSPQRLGGHWTAQALVSVTSVWGKICNLLNVSDMCKVSLDEKLRFQVLREQKHGAKAIVVDITCGGMLETYHKLKKKLWSILTSRSVAWRWRLCSCWTLSSIGPDLSTGASRTRASRFTFRTCRTCRNKAENFESHAVTLYISFNLYSTLYVFPFILSCIE